MSWNCFNVTKMSCEKRLLELDHHQQQTLCTSRPSYRQGRRLTAVKTYTISTESQHLFIYGVPKINLRNELKKLCSNYGQIHTISPMEDYKTEIFTECYHIYYQRIQSARIAKRFLDSKSFYGGVLHVCYAPEFETIEDTRRKLWQRTKEVTSRINQFDTELKSATVAVNIGFPNRHSSTPEEGDDLLFQHNSVPNYRNSKQFNWSEIKISSSNSQQEFVIKNPYDVINDAVQTENSTAEPKSKRKQNAAYSWKERKKSNHEAPLECSDDKFPDLSHRGKDTQDVPSYLRKDMEDIKNSNPTRPKKQTPAYYWKQAGESNISFKLQNRKRSGFVPRQVTKKQKQAIT